MRRLLIPLLLVALVTAVAWSRYHRDQRLVKEPNGTVHLLPCAQFWIADDPAESSAWEAQQFFDAGVPAAAPYLLQVVVLPHRGSPWRVTVTARGPEEAVVEYYQPWGGARDTGGMADAGQAVRRSVQLDFETGNRLADFWREVTGSTREQEGNQYFVDGDLYTFVFRGQGETKTCGCAAWAVAESPAGKLVRLADGLRSAATSDGAAVDERLTELRTELNGLT